MMMRRANRIPLSPLLRRVKYYFDLLKKTTDEYLFLEDLQEGLVMVSSNLVQDFDLPSEVIRDFDAHWTPLIHPEERAGYEAAMRSVRKEQGIYEQMQEYRVKSRKGEYVWLRVRGQVGTDRDGTPNLFAGIVSRMAKRNQADEVTGLLNKYQFEHGVKMALAAYRATQEGGAIMVFGLDNFKIVNETYNRVVGDHVLKRVATLVEELLPPQQTLYKLDGDEFAIIYPGAGEKEVAELFESIQACLARPQDIDGKTYFCTASAGTVFYPQAGKDYLVLHKHAEAAMDLAKHDGTVQPLGALDFDARQHLGQRRERLRGLQPVFPAAGQCHGSAHHRRRGPAALEESQRPHGCADGIHPDPRGDETHHPRGQVDL